ncbi:MAG: choice-of-anchor I domain-containing protein [bacterium]
MTKSLACTASFILTASVLAGDCPISAIGCDPTISMTFLGRSINLGYDVGATEISAFDPTTQRLFSVNGLSGGIDVWDFSSPALPIRTHTVALGAFGVGATSVAYANGYIVAAVEATVRQNPGSVVFIKSNTLDIVGSVTVGALPDMVTFTPDGTKAITANEGEPSSTYAVDPEGSISIIDVTGKAITQADVTTLGFNGLAPGVIDPAIVPFGPGSPTIGQDLEPEYVAVSADSTTAYVSIQEHSALATVDLVTNAIVSVKPLGTKKHYAGTPALTTAVLGGLPSIGTTAAGQDILLGGLSGLWIDSVNATTGVITFWANTDRGPNLEPVNVDGDAALERPFALPGFQPRIATFTYDPATNAIALTGQILLRKPDGTPMTGLPNIQGVGPGFANTDEQPVDLFGNSIPNDPLGGDLEGLCRTSDGSIWM